MTGLGCTISNCPPYVEPELIKLYTALFAVAGYAIEGSGTKPGRLAMVRTDSEMALLCVRLCL